MHAVFYTFVGHTAVLIKGSVCNILAPITVQFLISTVYCMQVWRLVYTILVGHIYVLGESSQGKLQLLFKANPNVQTYWNPLNTSWNPEKYCQKEMWLPLKPQIVLFCTVAPKVKNMTTFHKTHYRNCAMESPEGQKHHDISQKTQHFTKHMEVQECIAV